MSESSGYDRLFASLDGIPGSTKSRPSVIRYQHPILGNVETYIVQTFRHRDEDGSGGDTVFIEHTGPDKHERYYLPPDVSRAINRQRDHLETQNRRRAGRAVAEQRKAAGLKPAFMRRKGRP